MITEELAKKIKEAKVESVIVRSPLICKLRFGICAKCYGFNYATNSMAMLGDPVGIIAAQSIGEPGTQLTMRTKHSGGIAGLDVIRVFLRYELCAVPQDPSPYFRSRWQGQHPRD